ncbi:MAG: hypothetical protein COT55_02385 [Candidatus Diapherotrites archaeon CG09_land_8_20_14_0_10_32_12]|nr:MAG: hypothetical protein COT55_02385 [Candidatus Diapherotrites archaeon CG09_land_8_20_14_0_10_32_12]
MLEERIYLFGHLGMALFFLYAFFFQGGAGNWLLNNGLIMLILEAYGIILNIIVLNWYYKKIKTIKEKGYCIGVTIVFLLIASYVAYNADLFVFIYFLISFVINFYYLRQIIIEDEVEQKQMKVDYNLLMLVFAFILALIVFVIYSLATEPSNLVKTVSKSDVIAAIKYPELIAPWGFFYFFFLAVNPLLIIRKFRDRRKKKRAILEYNKNKIN